MICRHCNKEIEDGETHCPSCGNPIYGNTRNNKVSSERRAMRDTEQVSFIKVFLGHVFVLIGVVIGLFKESIDSNISSILIMILAMAFIFIGGVFIISSNLDRSIVRGEGTICLFLGLAGVIISFIIGVDMLFVASLGVTGLGAGLLLINGDFN